MKQVQVEVVFRSPSKGGRSTMPIGSGYRPHACAEAGAEYLGVSLTIPSTAVFERPFNTEIGFLYPDSIDYSPLLTGRPLMLMEGPRCVGTVRVIPRTE